MKVLIIGTWRYNEAIAFQKEAEDIGMLLAQKGHILLASPSSGIQGLVAESYKENGGREFIGYFPNLETMKEIGDSLRIIPDTHVYTNEDYPMRNLLQVRASEGIIMVTGGPNTYCEAKPATTDYNIPVAYLRGSSPEIEDIMGIDKSFAEKVYSTDNINSIIEFIENY